VFVTSGLKSFMLPSPEILSWGWYGGSPTKWKKNLQARLTGVSS